MYYGNIFDYILTKYNQKKILLTYIKTICQNQNILRIFPKFLEV